MNNKIILIGFTGKRNSGKSSAAAFLQNLIPIRFGVYKIGIADGIKETLAQLTGGNVKTIEANKNSPFIRSTLQHIGDIGRQSNPGHWMQYLQHVLDSDLEGCPCYTIVIVPDVRLKSEAAYLRQFPCSFIFRIERFVDKQLVMPSIIDQHITETELEQIKVDLTIHNDYTLLYLNTQIKYLFNDLILPKIESYICSLQPKQNLQKSNLPSA